MVKAYRILRRLALWALLPWLASPATIAAQEGQAPRTDLELVIAVDVSYSMDSEEQRLQRDGYVAAFRDPQLRQATFAGRLGRIAVTYVEWGGTPVQLIPWTIIDSPAAADRFADALSRPPVRQRPFTSISNLIAFARGLLHDNGIAAPRQVIDVSGDGPNNFGAPAPVARNAAVAEGIVIDGLPIMLERQSAASAIPDIDRYYEHCVIGGDGAFVISVKELGEFKAAILKKLVTEIAGLKLSAADAPRVIAAAADSYNCFIGEELGEKHD
jgi:hypothetical protein